MDGGGEGDDVAAGGPCAGASAPPRLLAGWSPRPRVTALALATYALTAGAAIALAGAWTRIAEPREVVEVMTTIGLAALCGAPALAGVVLALRRAAPDLRLGSVLAIGVLGAVAAPAAFIVALALAVTVAQVVEAWPSAPPIPSFAQHAAEIVSMAFTASVFVLPVTLGLGAFLSGAVWFAWSLRRAPPSRRAAAPEDRAPRGAPYDG